MLQKMKNAISNMSKTAKMLGIATAMAVGLSAVNATPLISNDTLDGLPSMGSQLSDFLGNLTPGLFKFLLLIGLAVAIVALITGIIGFVRSKATKISR